MTPQASYLLAALIFLTIAAVFNHYAARRHTDATDAVQDDVMAICDAVQRDDFAMWTNEWVER